MTMQVAQTILQQLGGKRFAMMTGAKDFIGGDNKLKFRIPMTKNITHVVVELTPADLYKMTFYRFNKAKLEMKVVDEEDGVYCDMLQDVFTEKTGLYTHL